MGGVVTLLFEPHAGGVLLSSRGFNRRLTVVEATTEVRGQPAAGVLLSNNDLSPITDGPYAVGVVGWPSRQPTTPTAYFSPAYTFLCNYPSLS